MSPRPGRIWAERGLNRATQLRCRIADVQELVTLWDCREGRQPALLNLERSVLSVNVEANMPRSVATIRSVIWTGRRSPSIVPISVKPGGGGSPSSSKMIVPVGSAPVSAGGPVRLLGLADPWSREVLAGPIGPSGPLGPGGPAAVGICTPIETVSDDGRPHWSTTERQQVSPYRLRHAGAHRARADPWIRPGRECRHLYHLLPRLLPLAGQLMFTGEPTIQAPSTAPRQTSPTPPNGRFPRHSTSSCSRAWPKSLRRVSIGEVSYRTSSRIEWVNAWNAERARDWWARPAGLIPWQTYAAAPLVLPCLSSTTTGSTSRGRRRLATWCETCWCSQTARTT
jgi:hypothetical protein